MCLLIAALSVATMSLTANKVVSVDICWLFYPDSLFDATC